MKKLFLFIIVISFYNKIYAQKDFSLFQFKDSIYYKVDLKDNSKIIGQYIEKDSASVTFKTQSFSSIKITFINIKDIDELKPENFKKGVYWFTNPNATRYLFAPSAFMLK